MLLVPIIILLGICASAWLIDDPRQKGAFVQASFRSNQAIMGLPLAVSLGGTEAAAIASLATSIGIPLFNISAVVILKLYSGKSEEKGKFLDIVKSLVTNPLITFVTANPNG